MSLRKYCLLNTITLLFVAGIFFWSCRKERISPDWETNILAPFFFTRLNISNLAGDSIIQVNPDNSLKLIYSNTLYSFNPNEDAIAIPDTTVKTIYKISNLQLNDQVITYPFSLGRFCQQLGFAGSLIIGNNGNNMVINPLNDQQSGDELINATDFFQSANVIEGFIDITLLNGFPIDISNLVFQIRNQINNEVIAVETFTNLLSNTQQTKTINLAGKYVEGTLVGRIIDLDTPGSNGSNVLIDTSDAILVTLKAYDMVVDNALASFPAQNIIDEDQETQYQVSGGAKLKTIRVKSGTLQLKINSTVKEKTYFTYSMPSATGPNGELITLDESVPAYTGGLPSSVNRSIDLAGYTINMQGITGDTYNTFVNHLEVRIDSTGAPISISSDDSIYIDYGLIDIVPEYVSGYLGQQIVELGPDENTLALFQNIKDGILNIEDLDVNLEIVNRLGAEGRIKISKLESVRSTTNNAINLSSSELINTPILIQRATDNPLTPSVLSFNLNSTNSNIKNWLENVPDKIRYELNVFLNPFGNTASYGDFSYNDTRIDINMTAEMPLSLIASNLKFCDTIGFNLQSVNQLKQLKSGTFYLICDNKMPLKASVHLILLDEWNQPLLDLTNGSQLVAAGEPDVFCKVVEAKRSIIELSVSEQQASLIQNARGAIITATFDTNQKPGCDGYLKIYDSNYLDCKLTGNFILKTKQE